MLADGIYSFFFINTQFILALLDAQSIYIRADRHRSLGRAAVEREQRRRHAAGGAHFQGAAAGARRRRRRLVCRLLLRLSDPLDATAAQAYATRVCDM